ncbi:hypothetical protein BAE44_0003914, partial [Dichanthelium oligosanthes]
LDAYLQSLLQQLGSAHKPSEASYPSLLNSTIQNLHFASRRRSSPRHGLASPAAGAMASRSAPAAAATTTRASPTAWSCPAPPPGPALSRWSTSPRSGARPIAMVDVAAAGARPIAMVDVAELYYTVARESSGSLGFPAGIGPTVCVGGHLSGGGFGPMIRKHGLAADNVVDAVVVNARGGSWTGRAWARASSGRSAAAAAAALPSWSPGRSV